MTRPALLHPTFRRISLYADGDLDPPAMGNVGAHLAGCARCRATLGRIRRLEEEVRALPAAPLPPGLRERVLTRLRAGESVIVPVADPSVRGASGARWPMAAAAAVVLLALAGVPFFLPGADLEANRSELVFNPAAPRPGDAVHVTYRPGSLFAGEASLRLRARYLRYDGLPAPGLGRQATVAELVRARNGVFEGTIRLPDPVVYAAFAVEDRDGGRVDSHERRLWELLVHGPDGRPRFEALAQRHFDHQTSNWELSRENARQATELYPGRIDAWFMRYLDERASFTGPAADSATARARRRLAGFDRSFRARRDLGVESELGIITRFAAAVDDTALHRYWRARLLRRAPNSLWGVQERLQDVLAQPDPRRGLPLLDSLWREVGVGRGAIVYLPFALYAATATGDTGAIRLWADRSSRYERGEADGRVGAILTQVPALREEGMDRLRARLRALERVDDAVRPLERTVPEERLARREEAQRVLADLGAALLASGRRDAALDTLDRATRTGWDADLVRRVADLRLQVGDTAGAVAPLSLAAADPLRGAALSDSARLLLGTHFDEAAWRGRLDGARQEMRERVLVHATRRPLPARVRLRTPDGRTVALREVAAGRPTFVAYWSRYCPPSAAQIPQLEQVVAVLRARGFAVVTVAEPLTPEFRRYLREHRLTLPVYDDPWKDLEEAVRPWGTPGYYVLDADGNLRFGPLTDLSAIPAQMAVVEEIRVRAPGR
ncbi:MAG TPA: redoxin domain-containing protein [Longimicrobium sp.]|nr:redoxin domain-containing protein [Longimicrobium sp.]